MVNAVTLLSCFPDLAFGFLNLRLLHAGCMKAEMEARSECRVKMWTVYGDIIMLCLLRREEPDLSWRRAVVWGHILRQRHTFFHRSSIVDPLETPVHTPHASCLLHAETNTGTGIG